MHALTVGLAGDFINFIASILLAWDPLFRERIYLSQKAGRTLPPEIQFLDYRGRTVQTPEQQEKVQVRGETNRTRFAYVMLIVGFARPSTSITLLRMPAKPLSSPQEHMTRLYIPASNDR